MNGYGYGERTTSGGQLHDREVAALLNFHLGILTLHLSLFKCNDTLQLHCTQTLPVALQKLILSLITIYTLH